MSKYDAAFIIRPQDKKRAQKADADWLAASRAGDREGMEAAHEEKEAVRAQYGYSGGEDGGDYLPRDTPYQSPYQHTLEELARRVTDPGEGFTYRKEEDPLYQLYEQTYTKAGQRAAEDTLGRAAARTGGLAGSYAVGAAMQEQDRYAAALAEQLPQLQQLAYDMYRAEQQADLTRLQAVEGLDRQAYSRYQDAQARRDQVADRIYAQEWDELSDYRDQSQQAQQRKDALDQQAREQVDRYLAMGGTVQGVYEHFDPQTVERTGYTPGQLAQQQRYYAQQNALKTKTGGSSGGGGGSTKYTAAQAKMALAAAQGGDRTDQVVRVVEGYYGLPLDTVLRAAGGETAPPEVKVMVPEVSAPVVTPSRREVDPVVVDAFNDAMEGGMDEEHLALMLQNWLDTGWRGVDQEDVLALLATIGK